MAETGLTAAQQMLEVVEKGLEEEPDHAGLLASKEELEQRIQELEGQMAELEAQQTEALEQQASLQRKKRTWRAGKRNWKPSGTRCRMDLRRSRTDCASWSPPEIRRRISLRGRRQPLRRIVWSWTEYRLT